MITLLMFSGGIDSAYLLVKLLTTTDDKLLVHHIHIATDFNRHKAEAESCKKIVEFCQKAYRTFSYTESGIDHRRFLSHGYDLIAAGFEAGVVASSFCAATKQNVDRWTVGLSLADHPLRRRLKNAAECCKFNCQQGVAPEFVEFPRVSQQEEIDYLPYDLYKMTWSCRSPRQADNQFKPCGWCESCQRLKKFAHKDEPLTKMESLVTTI